MELEELDRLEVVVMVEGAILGLELVGLDNVCCAVEDRIRMVLDWPDEDKLERLDILGPSEDVDSVDVLVGCSNVGSELILVDPSVDVNTELLLVGSSEDVDSELVLVASSEEDDSVVLLKPVVSASGDVDSELVLVGSEVDEDSEPALLDSSEDVDSEPALVGPSELVFVGSSDEMDSRLVLVGSSDEDSELVVVCALLLDEEILQKELLEKRLLDEDGLVVFISAVGEDIVELSNVCSAVEDKARVVIG